MWKYTHLIINFFVSKKENVEYCSHIWSTLLKWFVSIVSKSNEKKNIDYLELALMTLGAFTGKPLWLHQNIVWKYRIKIPFVVPNCIVQKKWYRYTLYWYIPYQSKKCTVSPLFSPYSSYLWIWTADELSWDVKVNVHKNTLFEASGKKIKFNLPLVSHSTAVELLFIYQMSSDMYEQWVHWQTLGIISCSIWNVKCD